MDNKINNVADDSLSLSMDSVNHNSPKQNKVFLTETRPSPGNYPDTRDIERYSTPDWILYFLIASLSIIAWLRVIYFRSINGLFRALYNYQIALKLYTEPGVLKKRLFALLNFYYIAVTSIFLWIIAGYFNYSPDLPWKLNLLQFIVMVVLLYTFYRFLIMKLAGFLFRRRELFAEAIYHNLLFNKVTGIVLAPLLFLITYTEGIYQDIAVYFVISAFTALMVLRFIRAILFIYKSVVLLFYFILYLCTLEILPVLVIIKLIFSLSKGP